MNRPGHEAPMIMGLNALPFGAVGSVAAFLRISVNLHYIGMIALRLLWSAYFDDFGVVSRDELIDNTSWSVETLFDLLGFSYAKEGVKAGRFQRKFKML